MLAFSLSLAFLKTPPAVCLLFLSLRLNDLFNINLRPSPSPPSGYLRSVITPLLKGLLSLPLYLLLRGAGDPRVSGGTNISKRTFSRIVILPYDFFNFLVPGVPLAPIVRQSAAYYHEFSNSLPFFARSLRRLSLSPMPPPQVHLFLLSCGALSDSHPNVFWKNSAVPFLPLSSRGHFFVKALCFSA